PGGALVGQRRGGGHDAVAGGRSATERDGRAGGSGCLVRNASRSGVERLGSRVNSPLATGGVFRRRLRTTPNASGSAPHRPPPCNGAHASWAALCAAEEI